MSDSNSSTQMANAPGIRRLWAIISCLAFGLAAGSVVWIADPNAALEAKGVTADGSYYNLLVKGFRAGHLNVSREPPPQLVQMSNPYDPVLNSSVVGPVNDLSYYNGKFYLYFGITPALVLYWPWVALTGHYMSDRWAVAVFFAVALAAAGGLLRDVRRRYFPDTSPWTIAASVLSVAFMLGLTLPAGIYQVAIVCGFAFVMLALAALWRALHEPQHSVFWLALSSLALGLAIGARPTLLFSIIIPLTAAAQMWPKTVGSPGKAALLLVAAAVPAIAIVLALMVYNDLRFGNPFEFGWHYQLNRDYDPTKARQFGLNYFWFNFRAYFLEPFECRWRFPFLRNPPPLHLPAGYDPGSISAGGAIWCRYPLVWLMLALPLAWIGKSRQTIASLRAFAVALLLFFVVMAFFLCLFFTTGTRYELDFLPPLLVLAVIGFLGAERAAAASPPARIAVRAIGYFLLLCSVAYNLLGNVENHAESHYLCGNIFLAQKRFDDAMVEYQKALAIWPDCLDARDGLGIALLGKGRLDDAILQFKKAVNLEPQSADAHERYGDALFQQGRISDAVSQYKKAAELNPDFAQAHENLGTCFARSGQLDQSIVQYQQAVKLQPNLMGPYYSLGNVCRLKGLPAAAVTNYQKAIELDPEFFPAQINLADVLATSLDPAIRDPRRAVTLMENANRATAGQVPQVLRTLAVAYAESGRYPEAITTAKKALVIATAESDAALVKKLEADIRLYQTRSRSGSGVRALNR